jgi:hypothetical protein
MVLEPISKLGRKVCRDEAMLRRPARHCERFPIKEFALEFGGPLDFKIFRLGQST